MPGSLVAFPQGLKLGPSEVSKELNFKAAVMDCESAIELDKGVLGFRCALPRIALPEVEASNGRRGDAGWDSDGP